MFNFLRKDSDRGNILCSAIIVAAGSSTRMSETGNKQFIEILGKPILAYTIETFENCELIDEIIIVTREEDIVCCSNVVVQPYEFNKVKKIIAGGSERQYSVYNGLKEVSDKCNVVVIHDGARPLVEIDEIEKTIFECLEHKAVTVGVKVKDTIKVVNKNGIIVDTPDRDTLWSIQTPQTFAYDIIVKAHEKALEDGFIGTDDAILVERLGYSVKVVEGNYKNIKITTREDLDIIKYFIEKELKL